MSDVDVICIQNPFDYIYRDSDVESMSDGHDNMTAYGYNDISDDPSMGWARYAYTMRIWVYNSGFFYLRPTLAAIELLDRVADRLSQPQPSWDQAVFNEELFFPSHPGYVGLHASKRTMDRYMFMNSKFLFKEVRKDGNLKKLKPVVIHLNYHPDKLPRMKAVFEFYFSGKQDALEPFPDGSDWTRSDNSMMIKGNGKQDALELFPDGSGSDWSGSDNSMTIKGNGKQEALEQFPDDSDGTGS